MCVVSIADAAEGVGGVWGALVAPRGRGSAAEKGAGAPDIFSRWPPCPFLACAREAPRCGLCRPSSLSQAARPKPLLLALGGAPGSFGICRPALGARSGSRGRQRGLWRGLTSRTPGLPTRPPLAPNVAGATPQGSGRGASDKAGRPRLAAAAAGRAAGGVCQEAAGRRKPRGALAGRAWGFGRLGRRHRGLCPLALGEPLQPGDWAKGSTPRGAAAAAALESVDWDRALD